MATSKRAPRRRTRRSGIEQTLRDAREVLSGYIDSGGKQVKSTVSALLKIFHMDAQSSGAETGARRRQRSAATRGEARGAAATRGRSATRRAPARAKKRAQPQAARGAGKSARQAAASRSAQTRRSKRPSMSRAGTAKRKTRG